MLEAGGGSWKWVVFRFKLGLLGGARQGPEQEPGPLPLLVHCARRDVKGAIFMKMDDIRPKAN